MPGSPQKAGVSPPSDQKAKGAVYMGKSNTSKITRLKTIRIKNEVADYFEGKPLNRAVEGLYRGLQSGEIKWRDGEIEIVGKYNMKPFERACKKLSVIPDKMLNNLVAGMERNYDNLKIERAQERAEKAKEKKLSELEKIMED